MSKWAVLSQIPSEIGAMTMNKGQLLKIFAFFSLGSAALEFVWAVARPSLEHTSISYKAMMLFGIIIIISLKEWIERLFLIVLVADMAIHSFLWRQFGSDGARAFRIVISLLYLVVAILLWKSSRRSADVQVAER
jgi:hypothetical protein